MYHSQRSQPKVVWTISRVSDWFTSAAGIAVLVWKTIRLLLHIVQLKQALVPTAHSVVPPGVASSSNTRDQLSSVRSCWRSYLRRQILIGTGIDGRHRLAEHQRSRVVSELVSAYAVRLSILLRGRQSLCSLRRPPCRVFCGYTNNGTRWL